MTGKFKLGDEVEWTSQAGACSTTKRGVVVEVVPAGQRPSDAKQQPVGRYGFSRMHESYVVDVPEMSPSRRRYWPHVGKLRLVGAK